MEGIKVYDLGIINGLIYIDHSFQKLNLYIKDGVIQALIKDELACRKIIDAQNKYVLPGLIDPHVHFALGVKENMSKDDFYSGSIEALYGGVTTYIDFLDPVRKASDIEKMFKRRKALAKNSVVDYAFHTTICNPISSAKDIIEASKEVGINSIKLFTTYSDTGRRTYDNQIYELLKESKKRKAWIVVHAENDDLINHSKEILVKDHEKARPIITENIEVMKLAEMARKTQGNLYIAHVSAGSTAKAVYENYHKELRTGQIVLESCPHYFLLNANSLKRVDGYKYTMTPPIREERERKLLNEYLQAITTIGTDHCPYTKEQKKQIYTSQIPMGIGGIRYSLLNMYNLYGFKILDKFTSGPAKVYGLKTKGSLLPSYDGDVVIFDKEKETIVEDEMSVYNQNRLKGAIETVILRGSVVLDKGEVKAHKGTYIERGEIDERY